MLLLKITVETHQKVLALIVDRITLQIAARVVTDVLARNEILQDKSKCCNYLKTGHLVKNCENQAPQNEIITSKDNNESGGSSQLL